MPKRTTIALIVFTLLGAACGPSVIYGDGTAAGEGADAGAGEDLVTLTMTLEGEGRGYVLVDGAPCDDAPCVFEIGRGAVVTLEAVPEVSANFEGWSVECENEALCEVTIVADKEVLAAFEPAGVIEQQQVYPEIARAVTSAVDSEGNAYYVGSFVEQAPPGLNVSGNNTGYIAKFSPEGQFIWSRGFNEGLVFSTYPTVVEIGPGGDIYVAGLGRSAQGAGSTPHIFFSRIAPASGQILWTFRPAGLALPTQLKVTANGNVFVAGSMTAGNNLLFDSGGVVVLAPAPGVYDSFTAMVSGGGTFLGATQQSPAFVAEIAGAVADPEGGVWIAASNDGVNLLQHYSESGVRDTSRPVPARGELAWAADGALIVAGRFEEAINWGNGTVSQPTSTDAFVAKMTLEGAIEWVNVIGGSSDQLFTQLHVDDRGDIFVGGYTSSAGTDLGSGALAYVGFDDAIVGAYAPDGQLRWSHSLGSTQSESINGLHSVGETLQVFVNAQPNTPISTELGILVLPPGHLDTVGGFGSPAAFTYRK